MKTASCLCVAILTAALLQIHPALANAATVPQITITGAWIRALPAGIPSGGYFTLHNAGPEPVTLVGASSPGCGMLMLHKSETMGGMSKMEDVTGVDVPPNGTIAFAPGGYHLMCMDAKPVIRPGGTVPVTLIFKNKFRLQAPFAVRNASGK